MLEILKAILYGIVEGISEWLPISSTGHLILVEKLIPFQETGTEFFKVFEVVIQLGAILAVVVLFWNKLWPFALTKKQREQNGSTGFMSFIKKDIWILWFKILVSCVPAAVIGILFDDKIDELFYNPLCVSLALIVFGIAFIVVEKWNRNRAPKINSIGEITFNTAFLVGMFQVLAAVFPGTSRSGATIVGALLLGVARTVIAEYTFYLAIPVMFGASLLKLVKCGFAFTGTELIILAVGTVVSFIVSVFSLRFLLGYVRKHDFQIFGYYRIVLGIIVLLLLY